jgi:hypothetical protein
MFQTYRSVPTEIKAVQFTDSNKDMVFNSLSGQYRADYEDDSPVIKIQTMHGEMATVRVGDWIVEDWVSGTYYPVANEVFVKRYVRDTDEPVMTFPEIIANMRNTHDVLAVETINDACAYVRMQEQGRTVVYMADENGSKTDITDTLVLREKNYKYGTLIGGKMYTADIMFEILPNGGYEFRKCMYYLSGIHTYDEWVFLGQLSIVIQKLTEENKLTGEKK